MSKLIKIQDMKIEDMNSHQYVWFVQQSKENFQKAFEDYIGGDDYESIKGTGMENIRKGEFADMIMWMNSSTQPNPYEGFKNVKVYVDA
jgi:hypothetical protein